MKVFVWIYGMPVLPEKEAYEVLGVLNTSIKNSVARHFVDITADNVKTYIDQHTWSSTQGRIIDVIIDGLPSADEGTEDAVKENVSACIRVISGKWLPELKKTRVTIRTHEVPA